jgi:hypothetical protein
MYSIARAVVAGLAVMAGVREAEAQQSLFKLSPGAYLQVYGSLPSGIIDCNISSAFDFNSSFPVSSIMQGQTPTTAFIDGDSIIMPWSNAAILQNGAVDSSILIDCDYNADCDSNGFIGSTNNGGSGCGSVGGGNSIDCTLYKTPSDNDTGNSSIRLHAKNYVPNSSGFPADATITIQPGTPFNFKYTSDKESNIEFIAISKEDSLYSAYSSVFMSCIQSSQTKKSASELSK